MGRQPEGREEWTGSLREGRSGQEVFVTLSWGRLTIMWHLGSEGFLPGNLPAIRELTDKMSNWG